MDHKPKRKRRCSTNPTKSVKKHAETEGGIGMFPVEIITNILSRLPVKSLLRFKSVSQWWYGLIISPEFSSLHLQGSLKTSYLLVLQGYKTSHTVEMDKVEKCDLSMKVDHYSQTEGYQVVGSCNGLVCISIAGINAILYNPSTRARHDLPPLHGDWPKQQPFHFEPYTVTNQVKFGFGYDSTSQDYKDWRICIFYADVNNCAFAFTTKVYSLNSNKWKTLENFPENIGEIESDSGVLCNETLHWVASVKVVASYRDAIVGFALHDETHHQLREPDHGLKFPDIFLGTLDGCLCAAYFPREVGGLHVWVMKAYGVKESWTRVFSLDREQLKPYSCRYFRPLVYSESGDEVLVDISGRHMLWYDLRNGAIKGDISCDYSSAAVCVQTLVSPKTGSLIAQEKQKGVRRILSRKNK